MRIIFYNFTKGLFIVLGAMFVVFGLFWLMKEITNVDMGYTLNTIEGLKAFLLTNYNFTVFISMAIGVLYILSGVYYEKFAVFGRVIMGFGTVLFIELLVNILFKGMAASYMTLSVIVKGLLFAFAIIFILHIEKEKK